MGLVKPLAFINSLIQLSTSKAFKELCSIRDWSQIEFNQSSLYTKFKWQIQQAVGIKFKNNLISPKKIIKLYHYKILLLGILQVPIQLNTTSQPTDRSSRGNMSDYFNHDVLSQCQQHRNEQISKLNICTKLSGFE